MGEILRKKIQNILNYECAESESDTPDFILAEYLMACLSAFDQAVLKRENWYGRKPDEE